MQIMNGDHAQFEIDHADTKPEDRPDWPLPSFDAMDWAKVFVKMHGGDEELMVTWFANALMRGHDQAHVQPWQNLDRILDALEAAGYCKDGYVHAPEDVVANTIRDWLRGADQSTHSLLRG